MKLCSGNWLPPLTEKIPLNSLHRRLLAGYLGVLAVGFSCELKPQKPPKLSEILDRLAQERKCEQGVLLRLSDRILCHEDIPIPGEEMDSSQWVQMHIRKWLEIQALRRAGELYFSDTLPAQRSLATLLETYDRLMAYMYMSARIRSASSAPDTMKNDTLPPPAPLFTTVATVRVLLAPREHLQVISYDSLEWILCRETVDSFTFQEFCHRVEASTCWYALQQEIMELGYTLGLQLEDHPPLHLITRRTSNGMLLLLCILHKERIPITTAGKPFPRSLSYQIRAMMRYEREKYRVIQDALQHLLEEEPQVARYLEFSP